VQSAPTTATLRAVDFAGTSTGWAAGDGGTVIRTADGGTTWSAESVPTTATLRSVKSVDASAAWAVGDGGAILHTADAGTTWSPGSATTTAALNGVDFARGGSAGVAVGEAGTVLYTTDRGATWKLGSAPTTATLRSVFLADSKNGSAVGDAGTVLRTTNGGANWSRRSAPTTATLSSVGFGDARNGWVVGDAGTVLRTTNAGATWVVQPMATAAQLTGVHFTDATSGWVTGGSGAILRATPARRNSFGLVAGAVRSATTGKPISGVSISIGGRPTAPSATDGTFVAARVPGGTYSLRFSKSRYITRSATGVGVSAGLRVTATIRLTPKTVTSLSKPSIVTTMPRPSQPVTISVSIKPSWAATAAATRLLGSHYEQKTVKKRVKGKTKKVKVWYWRSRFDIAMTPSAETPGSLTAHPKLAAGTWRVHAEFAGSGKTLPSTSATRKFDVAPPPSVPTTAGP
jgi:photosystem II stability/assembly factor-like uncharacterized protein